MKRQGGSRVRSVRRGAAIDYIPIRYVIAITLTVLEIAAIIGIVAACCYYIRFFYVAAWITEIGCVLHIVSSDDNPDYKVPWLLLVILLPVIGFMLYFMFYSRKLKKKYIRRLLDLWDGRTKHSDDAAIERLSDESPDAAAEARMIKVLSESHLYDTAEVTYFGLGEEMQGALLKDLSEAEHFIFMEYFIISEGVFWDSVLEVLRRKAEEGVKVAVLYDDIGCMSTLPGNYARRLGSYGILAAPFSRLKGNADSEINNRNHRKITVIDGRVGYTGGINLADEYINLKERFGHWKDNAIRITGEAVGELTTLFLLDFGITRPLPTIPREVLYPAVDQPTERRGYLIPFGDGPRPLYLRSVGKAILQSMLMNARRYVYLTTPYLIPDHGLCQTIEHAALRGVDVRIILPSIPDKRLIFEITRSYYLRLIAAGVRIFEYTPGFLHAKTWLADDEYAMLGTINLDYRSLVHHFENGVWMYRADGIGAIRRDLDAILSESREITRSDLRLHFPRRLVRSVLRLFSPLL